MTFPLLLQCKTKPNLKLNIYFQVKKIEGDVSKLKATKRQAPSVPPASPRERPEPTFLKGKLQLW
jgi:hypothetical protein